MKSYSIAAIIVSLLSLGWSWLEPPPLPRHTLGWVSGAYAEAYQVTWHPSQSCSRLYEDTFLSRSSHATENRHAKGQHGEPFAQASSQPFFPIVSHNTQIVKKRAGPSCHCCIPSQGAFSPRVLNVRVKPESCLLCAAGHVPSIDHPPQNIPLLWFFG
jgi:hypothetical protein